MLPERFEADLIEVVSSALERMAFMVGEPVPSPSPEARRAACIQVDVEGARYRVSVRATDGVLQELLSGLVDATTWDEGEAQLALDELANILGGEVLRLLGGDRRPSSLGLPRSGEGGPDGDDAVRCVLDFLGETLEVSVAPEEVRR